MTKTQHYAILGGTSGIGLALAETLTERATMCGWADVRSNG
jgi:NAD(P)-dependent dehydrogenase (short-subunit alcohol dehydrogenase family)